MNSLRTKGLTTGMAGFSQLVEAKLGPSSTRPPRPSWPTPAATPIVLGLDLPIWHRIGEPEYVAALAVFVASDEPGGLTGVDILLDGDTQHTMGLAPRRPQER